MLQITKRGHINVRVAYDFSLIAKSSGNRIGTDIGYCRAILIRTNLIAISTDGANGPLFSAAPDATTCMVRR